MAVPGRRTWRDVLASRPALRTGRSDDSGITLIELIVSMALMSVVTILFAGGMTQAYLVANKASSMTDTQSAQHQAFGRLDRQVRYASGISVPGTTGRYTYVEFAGTDGINALCTQLRLPVAGGVLELRVAKNGATPGSWSTLAWNVVPPSHFARTAADPNGSQYQTLSVVLSVRNGAGTGATTLLSSVEYTALNTGIDTTSDQVCSAMGRAP